MTLTDLSDEHNRRDCLAELDRVHEAMAIAAWMCKWREGLRDFLKSEEPADLTDQLTRAEREATEAENERDDALRAIRSAITILENAAQ